MCVDPPFAFLHVMHVSYPVVKDARSVIQFCDFKFDTKKPTQKGARCTFESFCMECIVIL
jgi:hypothetical protein